MEKLLRKHLEEFLRLSIAWSKKILEVFLKLSLAQLLGDYIGAVS